MSLKKKWIAAALALVALIACMKAGDGVGLDTNGQVIPFCVAHPDDPSCDVCVITPASKACSTSMCAKDTTLAWCHTQPDCNATPKPAGCVDSCTANPDLPGCKPPTRFTEVYAVFKANGCATCHSGTGAGATNGKLYMGSQDSAYANLVGILATNQTLAKGWMRVLPGKPDSSILYFKVAAPTPIVKLSASKTYMNRMPLDAATGIPDDQIQLIRKWIQDGALK